MSATAERLPLVSCLVCTYDFEAFLPRALDSALAQDYPADRLEIVVVDDGSTDATPEVVGPYLDRILYVRKENGGLNSTINRALAEATGDLLMLLSGDDEWPPDRVRRHVDFLAARPEVGLVYGDLEVIDEDGRVVEPSFWRAQGISPLRGRPLAQLLRGNFVSGGALTVRASLRERFAPIPSEIAWEDWWIAARVAEVADLDYVEEPVYRYRLHGRNMNLGVPAERRGPLLAAELPTRRHLLRRALGGVSAEDALEGYRSFEDVLHRAAELLCSQPAELVPVIDEDSSAASLEIGAAAEAWRAGDADGATRSLVAALACDPFDDGTRALLGALMRGLRWPPSRERTGPVPLVSIVVPVYGKLALTRQCLEGIRRTAGHVPHEVIVVDDCSDDGTREYLRAAESRGELLAVLNEENSGFGRSCNLGAKIARGDHLVFLNNDTIPLPGWLDALVDELETDAGVGAVGSLLLYPSWQVQHAGIAFDTSSRSFHVHRGAPMEAPEVARAADVPAVTGACLAVRRELFETLGGFSAAYRMYVEDVDLCLAVWHAGLRVRYRPDSVLVHLENASIESVPRRDELVREGWRTLHERWAGRLPEAIAGACGDVLARSASQEPVRRLAGLAFADELLERPELLAAYGRAFSGADDATLVIRTRGAVDRLGALVDELGLGGEEGPDMLAVGAETEDDDLRRQVAYVLTGRELEGVLGALPRYDETSIDALGER
jgi:GT2 family glycosyltransferase